MQRLIRSLPFRLHLEIVLMMKRVTCTGRGTTAVASAIVAILPMAMLMFAISLHRHEQVATLDLLASLESRLDSAEHGTLKVRRNDKGEIQEVRLYLKGSGLSVGNEFLEAMTSLPFLRKLIVFHSGIDDDGLRAIRRMPQLEELAINYAPITDTGLKQLRGLGRLRQVQFFGADVTRDGARKLHSTIPMCEILDCWCCGCMTIEPRN